MADGSPVKPNEVPRGKSGREKKEWLPCLSFRIELSTQPHFYLQIHFPPNGITSQLITLTNRISAIFFPLFFFLIGFSINEKQRRMVQGN